MDRYIRQSKIVDNSILRKLNVCVVGLGGLGSIVSLYLTYLGVGSLILVDKDKVDTTNLNRQVLYTVNDIGKLKIEVAKEKLKLINPDIKIQAYKDADKISKIRCDFIFDCLDNWKHRLILDEISHKINAILIHGGVKEFFGQVYFHIPGKNPCFESIFKIGKKEQESFQIVGPTCGIIGSLMVQLMLLYLKGHDVWKWLYLYRYDKIEKVKVPIEQYGQD